MKQITATVTGQNLVLSQTVLNVSGTVNLYKLILELDSDWDEIDTIIVSFASSCGKAIAVEYDRENGVTIPWEVLQAPENQIAKVAVGVLGYQGTTQRITTTGVYDGNVLIITPASLGLEAAMTPTPDIYQQLKQLIAAQNNAIGQLSNLDTDDKTSLVDAINEVLGKIDTGGGTVKSVNGVLPDQDGNVELSAEDVGAAAKTALEGETSAREQADADLQNAVNAKQTALSQTQLDAVNSGIDSTKVGQIATNATNIAGNASDIDAIEQKIPGQASAQNQLADKAFVNSSVATNTANYISDNGKPFSSLADLQAYSGTLTNNDYAFVVGTDAVGNTTYTRYKYNADTEAWAEEYVLNNSSFTATQWAAINSAITSGLVEKLQGIEAGAEVNAINSISVNGTAVTPDANKNVDLTIDAGIKTLTEDDYNYPANNPQYIALWLLTPGLYAVPQSLASHTLVSLSPQEHIDAGNSDNGNELVAISGGTNGFRIIYPGVSDDGHYTMLVKLVSSAGTVLAKCALSTVDNLTNTSTMRPLSANQGRVLKGLIDALDADKLDVGTMETLTIATSDWAALSSSEPYDYQATVSVTTTISANGTVELVNDQPVLFATYGFAIGTVDTTNNAVTIYSVGQPDASVSLNINVKG